MLKNLPSNAGAWGSIPAQGPKVPQTEEQPSRRATAAEAQVESLSATRKDPFMLQLRPRCSQINIYIFF